MPTVQITAQASTEELLRSVASLPAAELDQFVARVLALRARLKAPSLPEQEAALLRKINSSGLSTTQQHQFAELDRKRQAETLSTTEHRELLNLIDEMEAQNVERMRSLTLLAQLRQVSLTTLMQNLGIKVLPYA